MAEKPHAKKKHKKPHKIITTQAKDGSFGHEHVYDGDSQPVFAGTSRDIDDVKQHHEDHFGGGGAAEEMAEAAGGGGGAPAAGGGGEEEPEPQE